MFSNKNVGESSDLFCCEKCQYYTVKKFNYDKHLFTSKHLKSIFINENVAKSSKSSSNNICNNCKKIYKDPSGLWRHKKTCSININNSPIIEEKIIEEKNIDVEKKDELINFLLKENQEFKGLILEVCKNFQNSNNFYNNTNTINSHNKTFNLQVFLNETCKDAMNFSEFIDSFDLKLSDLESMGKLGFVDSDSNLYTYPSTNQVYTDSYRKIEGIETAGNDIPGAAYGNATVEQCQATCDSTQECAGFAFSDNVCYPKTSSMFPNGAQQINSRVNLYTRNKAPINPPVGVPGTVVNVDTIMYDKYTDGGDISSEYGLANATSTQKQQLEQLQDRLNMLTSQINGYTNKFSSGTDSLNNQSSKNMEGLGDYLKDYKKTNTTIKNFNTNIENILNDSDITVLQKNYDYLFWSILAAGTVLITMNIAKKQ